MISVNNLYIKELDCHINCDFIEGINYLKGKNGSGKTLLLDYISGLRTTDFKSSISNNNDIIYMRQNFTFYSRLTVGEYIDFIQKLNGESTKYFIEFLAKYFPEMNFEKYKKKRLGLISGGERRLIYTLSILSIKRRWYILDEPFANIDQETKEQLVQIIKTLNLDQKANFILTSHESMEFENLHTIDFNYIIQKSEV